MAFEYDPVERDGEDNCVPFNPFKPIGHRHPDTYNSHEVMACLVTSERQFWRLVKSAGLKLRRGGRFRWFTRDQIFELLGELVHPENESGPSP